MPSSADGASGGRLNQLLQNRNREVRFANAGLPFQKQAARGCRKLVSDTFRLGDGPLERLIVSREISEGAVEIPLGNVRVDEARLANLLAPAIAADDPADTVLVNRFPAGIVAERTGH